MTQFEKVNIPIIITESGGKIILKNKIAKAKLDIFRSGANLHRLLDRIQRKTVKESFSARIFTFNEQKQAALVCVFENFQAWMFLSPLKIAFGTEIFEDVCHIIMQITDSLLDKIAKADENSNDILKKINACLADNVGGMWEKDEALFHVNEDGINDVNEQEAFCKLLFGGKS